MARKSPPQEPRPADVSPEQMKAAIPKLERRIAELRALDPSSVRRRGDPRFEAVEHKIDDTLVETFGNDTVEYRRYNIGSLDSASINSFKSTRLHEVQQGYARSIVQAISTLQTIIELFKEKLADLGETPTGRASKAFAHLRIHPELEKAVGRLFRDGHYANAVEDACKVLDGMVRMRSGRFDLGGTELMQTVFSPKAPILRFNDLTTESDRSEQQGMMFLYSGAMLALRNPRAHSLMQDKPEQAVEYIGFLSLLLTSLDRATRS